jgi:NitT/TauT family transport system permease protein
VMGAGSKWRSIAFGLISMMTILVVWQLIMAAGLVNPFLLSSPLTIAAEMGKLFRSGDVVHHFVVSGISLLLAFAMAGSVGVLLGVLAGWYRPIERALDPFIWFAYSTPAVAFYPVFVAWFGFGRPTAVAVAVVFAVTPIYANTLTGMKAMNADLVRMAQSFGAEPKDIFASVVIPGSVPLIVGGLQLGAGRALTGVVIAELFGSNAGLGFAIAYNAMNMDTAKMMVYMCLVVILGLMLTQLMAGLARYADRWRP